MLKNINPTNVMPSYIADFYTKFEGINHFTTFINQSIALKVGKVYYVKLNRENGFQAIKILGGFLAKDGSIGGYKMVYVYKTAKKEIKAIFSSQFEHVFATKEDYIEFAKTGKISRKDLCCNKIGFYNKMSVLAQVFPKTFEMLADVSKCNAFCYDGVCKRDDEDGTYKIYQYSHTDGKVVNAIGAGVSGFWIDENGEHLIWDREDIDQFYNSKDECFEAEFEGIDDDFSDEEESKTKTRPINVTINVTINSTDEETAKKAVMAELVNLL